MNTHLSEAIRKIDTAKALMYAYEKTFLDLEVAPHDRERADMAASTFYQIWDILREVSGELELLDGDRRVVDAIYAVNDVRRRESTLKTED